MPATKKRAPPASERRFFKLLSNVQIPGSLFFSLHGMPHRVLLLSLMALSQQLDGYDCSVSVRQIGALTPQ